MSTLRLAGFAAALVLAALVGGTLMTAVAAAPASIAGTQADPPTEPTTEPAVTAAEPGPYCVAFRAALARNLDVTEAELVAAVKAAIGTAVDDAVADGTLTKAAADRIKARVAAAEGDGCGILAGWRGRVARQAIGVGQDVLTAAAEAMDMTLPEVREQLRSGKTLQEVAAAAGVPYATVTAAALAAGKADLDAAVAAGTITQARADRMLDRLERRLEAGWSRGGRGNRGASAAGG